MVPSRVNGCFVWCLANIYLALRNQIQSPFPDGQQVFNLEFTPTRDRSNCILQQQQQRQRFES